MNREVLFAEAESCIKAPEESVLIATEETKNNKYSFWRDSEGKIWYTSERTDAFNAEMEKVRRKRKTSDATSQEASEEPAMLNITNHYKESIA